MSTSEDSEQKDDMKMFLRTKTIPALCLFFKYCRQGSWHWTWSGNQNWDLQQYCWMNNSLPVLLPRNRQRSSLELELEHSGSYNCLGQNPQCSLQEIVFLLCFTSDLCVCFFLKWTLLLELNFGLSAVIIFNLSSKRNLCVPYDDEFVRSLV